MQDRIVFIQEEPRGPSQLIEVKVLATDTGSQSIEFPDVQQLRSQADQRIILKGMRLITADVLAKGVVSGLTNAPLAELQKIVLVIYCEGWEKAFNMPILQLNDIATPGGTFPHRYHATKFNDWENVDWSKTKLVYSNGTTGAQNTPYCVMFDVEYIKLNAQGGEIIGPS